VWIDHVAVYRATPDVNDGDCVALGSDPSDGGLEFDHIQPCPAAANVDVGIDTAALADGAHDLQVQVTDAAGNTATVLDQETTTSNPTATPLPRRRGEVRARLTIRWSWNGLRTRVRSVRARGLPGSARLTVRCTGRGCARLPRRAAAGAQPGSCTIGRPPHDRDRDRLPPPRGARSTGPSETGIPVPGRARAHPSRRPAASVRRAQGMAALKVIVCGSGIAGIEGLLRLRRLAREHVELTLLSPADEFVYRPLAVLEPFTQASVRRYPLAGIAADTGASWIRDSLIRVNTSANRVIAGRGSALPYDALLLAIGAGESPPFAHAQTFTDRDAGAGFRAIVSEIERGEVATVAFVVPNWPVWSIPLYELALMTAQRTRAVRPLKAFGQAAGDVITRLLADAAIEFHTDAVAAVPEPGIVAFGGQRLHADRIVTLPRVDGPAVQGLPAGAGWFVPVDSHCIVPGTGGRVFAAGDATDFTVKHGGIGSQQADTAAAGIAHLAGVGHRPPPLSPVIRSMLLTGDRPLYLVARVVDGIGWSSEVYEEPPWATDAKVVAEELGPYLAGLAQRQAA
jgi:sulfide:quinone oxidoreductase